MIKQPYSYTRRKKKRFTLDVRYGSLTGYNDGPRHNCQADSSKVLRDPRIFGFFGEIQLPAPTTLIDRLNDKETQ
jgi:hypothetical protein